MIRRLLLRMELCGRAIEPLDAEKVGFSGFAYVKA
jgi:hypothetical protein